ncbi:hypothetical protein NPIL_620841, partial [Nephila pilipes]
KYGKLYQRLEEKNMKEVVEVRTKEITMKEIVKNVLFAKADLMIN